MSQNQQQQQQQQQQQHPATSKTMAGSATAAVLHTLYATTNVPSLISPIRDPRLAFGKQLPQMAPQQPTPASRNEKRKMRAATYRSATTNKENAKPASDSSTTEAPEATAAESAASSASVPPHQSAAPYSLIPITLPAQQHPQNDRVPFAAATSATTTPAGSAAEEEEEVEEASSPKNQVPLMPPPQEPQEKEKEQVAAAAASETATATSSESATAPTSEEAATEAPNRSAAEVASPAAQFLPPQTLPPPPQPSTSLEQQQPSAAAATEFTEMGFWPEYGSTIVHHGGLPTGHLRALLWRNGVRPSERGPAPLSLAVSTRRKLKKLTGERIGEKGMSVVLQSGSEEGGMLEMTGEAYIALLFLAASSKFLEAIKMVVSALERNHSEEATGTVSEGVDFFGSFSRCHTNIIVHHNKRSSLVLSILGRPAATAEEEVSMYLAYAENQKDNNVLLHTVGGKDSFRFDGVELAELALGRECIQDILKMEEDGNRHERMASPSSSSSSDSDSDSSSTSSSSSSSSSSQGSGASRAAASAAAPAARGGKTAGAAGKSAPQKDDKKVDAPNPEEEEEDKNRRKSVYSKRRERLREIFGRSSRESSCDRSVDEKDSALSAGAAAEAERRQEGGGSRGSSAARHGREEDRRHSLGRRLGSDRREADKQHERRKWGEAFRAREREEAAAKRKRREEEEQGRSKAGDSKRAKK